jgi:cytochrome P450
MGMAQYAVFRSPANFQDPELYLPERWLDTDGPYANDRREALQPFSFGPRNCIGRKYGLSRLLNRTNGAELR